MNAGEQVGWEQVWDQFLELVSIYAGHLGPAFSPMNVLATLTLCLVLWLWWRPGVGFFAWVFPARIYATASFALDVKLMLLNWFIGLFARLNHVAIATITAFGLFYLLGLAPPGPDEGNPVLTALVAFLAGDLAMYWYHRLNHGRPVLWAFHAVHHSAEELSPVTAFRHHPLYSITVALIVSVAIGIAQGLAIALFVGSLDLAVLAGTNAFIAILNLATNNLKHSHIRLRYPAWLEHILISPAQHQVHHSSDPRHFNRNYADILALWDWIFGTLYISRPNEEIRFGLGDAQGVPVAQPHPTLRAALVEPVARARQAMRRR